MRRLRVLQYGFRLIKTGLRRLIRGLIRRVFQFEKEIPFVDEIAFLEVNLFNPAGNTRDNIDFLDRDEPARVLARLQGRDTGGRFDRDDDRRGFLTFPLLRAVLSIRAFF